ncbi:MATH and LRR domain-containing protein PFE0570w-like [Leptopilina heterotoma]|uniref:MATH and LRR domain-containing protein PFE0570w-like n=1 Tax=Leptopilina heterotoma TaxID=63436 RepID=UPI001CA8206E|nr:MATH and LRR domain-containing protein PFE0570w-like [Leptopilina heterotoma]
MGENEKEFVLQWDGHAGYVTERFSGLLARQALVDVTLICEEQKLRVHKLVLASCSLYFEEMLEQDLGQEPIIVLKDLNFEVLKAMVEFMYCGETTISQKYLPSLLIAARLFKVNELEFIAKQISESQKVNTGSSSDKIFEDYTDGSEFINKLVEIDSDCEEIIPDTQNNNDCYDIKDISDTESEKGPSMECCSASNDSEAEHTLYGEIDKNISEATTNEMERISKILKNEKSLLDNESIMIECDNDEEEDDDDEDDNSSEKTNYEECCDYSNDESRKSSQQQDETDERYSSDSTDVGNKVGQCLKVYTHKKRKSINKIRNHLLQFNELLPELPTTKSIDLLNDSSSDETSLNIENSEYVSSLTSENIQSIVGCTLNEFNLIDSDNELCNGFFPNNVDKQYVVDSHKEIRKVEFFTEYENCSLRKQPILRRSVRLSQQESEESIDDFLGKTKKHKIRIVDRERSTNKVNIFPKKKRKRHSETTVSNTKHNRTLRKTTKLGKYRTRTKLETKEDKEKVKNEKEENFAQQLNTIATVNRALWGDMTDISLAINGKDSMECSSPSMEIPFAVGLLPLRAALEKMQAMPDYQPRKTRSSVAPAKQDLNHKRKINNCEIANNSKKNIASESIIKENAKTVCHIEIRTASQCSRSRKRSLSDCSSVEPTAIADKQ